MQSFDSQKITKRFFEAIYALKEKKVIRGKQTITRELSINNRNFWQLEKDMSRDIMQMSWIAHLITQYDVSAEWIMTGVGAMFAKEPTPKQAKNKK